MSTTARPGWYRPAEAFARSVEALGADHAETVRRVVERAGGQPKAFTPDEFTMAVARATTDIWNKLDVAKGDAALSMDPVVVGVNDEVGALHLAARKVRELVSHLQVPRFAADAVAIALGRGVLDYLDADAAWRESRRRLRTGTDPDPSESVLVDGLATSGVFRYSSACRLLVESVAVAVAAFYVERARSNEELAAMLRRANRELVGVVATELYAGTAEVVTALDGARRIVETDLL